MTVWYKPAACYVHDQWWTSINQYPVPEGIVESKLDGQTDSHSHNSADLWVIQNVYTKALKYSTVKTLYNVTLYNRIFNIRHKYVGNGSVSIRIPSL